MSRLRLWLATIATAIGILAMTMSPASAHTSYYEGHGSDGYTYCTTWLHSHTWWVSWAGRYGHYHHYEHTRWCAWKVHSDEHRLVSWA